MSNSRIPTSIISFNVYLNNTTNFLNEGTPKNSVRLGLTDEELASWSGINTRWIPLFALYTDKANARTQAVTAQLQDLIDEFYVFNQTKHLLDRIAASSNVTVVDLQIFNIKNGQSKHSVGVQPIQDVVISAIQLLGGGSVTIKCNAPGYTRPAIIDVADSLQVAFMIGTTPPESADDMGLRRDVYTKATFTLPLGSGNTGKYLYIYYRWYIVKHPELAGPWTALQTTLIV